MRIVFMGTPDFAAASLDKLIQEKYDIAAVFTQPDKPRNRGMAVSFSPVKELALQHGIDVYQPTKLRDGSFRELIRSLCPDILVVVAYGRILPEDVLSIPQYGAINVHASLLPKYRGSAPVQWSVLNGDKVTGVTTMYLAREMDTGDMIYSESTEIGEFETSGELFDRLMAMGADLLIKTLNAIENGTAPRVSQNEAEASYVTMLDKSMSPIDWTKSPREIVKHIYGLRPWPVATMEVGGDTFRVFAAEYTENNTEKPDGTLLYAGKKGLEFACGGGKTLMITELQAAGKKRMKASDYLLGHPIRVED